MARKQDIVVDRKNVQKWSFLRHDNTALEMATFQKNLASFCTEEEVHVNPESTRIFLLSQKVWKPRIYLHQSVVTGFYTPVMTKSY